MRVNVAPGRYLPGDSPLHRADPRAKAVAVCALMFGAFLVSSVPQALLAALAYLGLCALAGVGPLTPLRSCAPVLAMLCLVACLNLFFTRTGAPLLVAGPLTVTTGGAATAATYAVRLSLMVLSGSLLLLTTTPTDLSRALGSLLSPVGRLGVPVDSLALVLSLALRFVPTLADEMEGVMEAQTARGASFDRGGPLRRLKSLASVLVPTFVGALRHADGLSLALEARGYEPGRPRTQWHEPRMRRSDVGLLLATAAYLAALVVLGPAG